jgi:ubiquinone/menaquinone biosynthesis C-methylase UbiE
MAENICIEINRIKEVYKKRDGNISATTWKNDIYHPRHPIGRLFYEHNYNILVDALNSLDIDLESSTVLDVGCGEGAWLRFLVEMGAKPANLNGIDLSESRIEIAKQLNPAINLSTSQGDSIPFQSSMFDIVMQVVVFSSIIEQGLAQMLVAEMLRVTKPGGCIFWIDHKKRHSETLAGYSVEQLTEYLPGCSLIYQESVHPRYFRNWHHYPWLCRLLYEFTRKSCDAWLLVFRKDFASCNS